MPSFRRGRFALGGAAMLCTLALAGCGSSGVMHDGSTALTYDGKTVTNDQLQTAAKDISAFVGGPVDPGVVAGRLAIGPQVEKYAAQKGQSPITASQIQAQKPKAELSDVALKALEVDALISTLANNGDLDNASLQALTKKSNVTVNPRYGAWEKGKGMVADSDPWIKATPSGQAAQPQGQAQGQG
ncbi:YgdI/YgdR family lipoprotein [Flexivirga lutea]